MEGVTILRGVAPRLSASRHKRMSRSEMRDDCRKRCQMYGAHMRILKAEFQLLNLILLVVN